MKKIEEMDKYELCSQEVFQEVCQIKDAVEKDRTLRELRIRARKLKSLIFFNKLLILSSIKYGYDFSNYTQYTDCPYPNVKCGEYVATDEGVYYGDWRGEKILITTTPITVIDVWMDEVCFVKLAYKQNGEWKETVVENSDICAPRKILKLRKLGISILKPTKMEEFLTRLI